MLLMNTITVTIFTLQDHFGTNCLASPWTAVPSSKPRYSASSWKRTIILNPSQTHENPWFVTFVPGRAWKRVSCTSPSPSPPALPRLSGVHRAVHRLGRLRRPLRSLLRAHRPADHPAAGSRAPGAQRVLKRRERERAGGKMDSNSSQATDCVSQRGA